MNKQKDLKIALFPGSFDPITLGHLDLIKRSAKIFDQVIVGIFTNTKKKYLLNPEERFALTKQILHKLPNVSVKNFSNQLTAEVAQKLPAKFLIRGIRNIADYEYEREIAYFNSTLANSSLETIFLLAKPEFSCFNSSMIKEIWHFKGDVSKFLPVEVCDFLKKRS